MAEAASAFLWDLNTTGIADLGDDDETGFTELIAGFETRPEAEAASAAMTKGQGDVRAETVSIEAVEVDAWVDEGRTGRLEIGDTSTDFLVGGAFGHGGHPTTSLALALLALVVEEGATVLDFGTGTGVLTMAAASFGATKLVAVDNDSSALAVAEANLAAVDPPATIEIADRLRSPDHDGPFDVIAANVLLPVHVEYGAELVKRLDTGGSLIVSGVLVEQESQVLDCYQDLRTEHRHQHDDWLALSLRRPVRG